MRQHRLPTDEILVEDLSQVEDSTPNLLAVIYDDVESFTEAVSFAHAVWEWQHFWPSTGWWRNGVLWE